MERRLESKRATDVAGYLLPMVADDEGTLTALTTQRLEFTNLKLAEHKVSSDELIAVGENRRRQRGGSGR